MQLYFSGISEDYETLSMVIDANAKNILLNWNILQQLNLALLTDLNISVDCNDWVNREHETFVGLEQYIYFAHSLPLKVDFWVAPDVIKNPDLTFELWQQVQHDKSVNWLPVWRYGSNLDYLKYYLDTAEWVGIGGLVSLMREGKQKTDASQKMLTEIVELCQTYPQRFHIFGICWLTAIEQLKGIAKSGDTSKALDGARYGDIIFQHSKSGRLQQCKYKLIPQFSHLTNRYERCVECVKNLDKFCN